MDRKDTAGYEATVDRAWGLLHAVADVATKSVRGRRLRRRQRYVLSRASMDAASEWVADVLIPRGSMTGGFVDDEFVMGPDVEG